MGVVLLKYLCLLPMIMVCIHDTHYRCLASLEVRATAVRVSEDPCDGSDGH